MRKLLTVLGAAVLAVASAQTLHIQIDGVATGNTYPIRVTQAPWTVSWNNPGGVFSFDLMDADTGEYIQSGTMTMTSGPGNTTFYKTGDFYLSVISGNTWALEIDATAGQANTLAGLQPTRTFTGDGEKQTQPFTTSAPFKIHLSAGAGFVSAELIRPGASTGETIAGAIGPFAADYYVYTPGQYYLRVISGVPWTATISSQ